MSTYQRRRRELVDDLARSGYDVIRIEEALRAWEYEANRGEIDQLSNEFWRQGRAFVMDRLGDQPQDAAGK